MIDLLIMCWEFFKAGLFALGGGVVAIPFFNDMAIKYGWFSTKDIADMIAISEATPGPFGINMATFAGYKIGGIIGSALGVFFLVLPSFVIIIIVSKFLDKFSENKYVKAAFKGLRPCVCGLVLNAWYSIMKVSVINPSAFIESKNISDFFNFVPLVIFVIIFIGSRYIKKLPPAAWIAIGALAGLIFL